MPRDQRHYQLVVFVICYYISDCSPAAIVARFPELFRGVDQEFPENFTVTYNEREALELGGRRNYFYPGINIELYPKSPSRYPSPPPHHTHTRSSFLRRRSQNAEKSSAHQKGDYCIKQRFFIIASLFKWELLLKERICFQREQILSFKSSSLRYGKLRLPHKVSSLECYFFYYARVYTA